MILQEPEEKMDGEEKKRFNLIVGSRHCANVVLQTNCKHYHLESELLCKYNQLIP